MTRLGGLVLAAALGLAACGKYGPPVRPEPHPAPKPTAPAPAPEPISAPDSEQCDPNSPAAAEAKP